MNFKAKNKVTLGLTGGILCGKSTLLAAFARCGAFTLSCDELVREISARPAVRKQIAALFATTDKAALAARVFSDVSARKKLEALLHPLVLKEVDKRLKKAKEPVRVAEVPLLFEAGLQDGFDLTVAVAAPESALAARAAKRAMKKTDFLKRRKAQLPQREKAARADVCIVNDGAAASLDEKAAALYHAVSKLYTA